MSTKYVQRDIKQLCNTVRDLPMKSDPTLAPASDSPVVIVGSERMQNRRTCDSMVVSKNM